MLKSEIFTSRLCFVRYQPAATPIERWPFGADAGAGGFVRDYVSWHVWRRWSQQVPYTTAKDLDYHREFTKCSLPYLLTNAALSQVLLSVFGYVSLTISSLTATPIAKWPDLFPLAFAVYSCAHFVLFYLIFAKIQFSGETSTGRVSSNLSHSKST